MAAANRRLPGISRHALTELDLSGESDFDEKVNDDMPRGATTARLRGSDLPAPNASFAEQLRETLNAIPAHTWCAAPSGALVFLNERAADNAGLPRDHPLRFGIDTGASWDSHIPFLHPDDHDESRRFWSNCLKTERAGEVTWRARNARGEYRWYISRAEPLRAKDGTLLYWIGINLDIEERVQAESASRKSEEQLRQILDLTPQIIGVVSPRRERLYANRTALDYFGISLDEWRNLKPGSDVHPDGIRERAAGTREGRKLSMVPGAV
jgi:PAS domain-containing protein